MNTLSTQEIATDLGLTIRSIQRYINEGFLPATQVQNDKGQIEYAIEYFTYQAWKIKHFQGIRRGKINKTNRLDKELNLSELKNLSLEWLLALKQGTFNGKIYSPMTRECYEYQIGKYWKLLDRYAPRPYLSHENLSRILSKIPVDSYASRQKLFDSLWCFMKYLLEKGLVPESEINRIRKLKPKRFLPAKKITFTENQIALILKTNDEAKGNGPYDKLFAKAVVIVLANTGLRVSELCNLKLEDIDLEQRTLYVWNGKGNKNRRIGLNQTTTEILQKYLIERLKLAQHERFFLTRHGEKVCPNALRHKWRRLSNKLGFKITNHGFRRSFVTINNRKGRSLVDLQIACAHSDISMTRSYCMTTEDEVVDAMKGW